MLFSAVVLLVSLFLAWSRLSPDYVAVANRLRTLQTMPHDPTGWQVFSAADVLLVLLALALIAVALKGPRRARIGTLLACVLALAFTIRAEHSPPTNGEATDFRPGAVVTSYVAPAPTPGAGETAALVALVAAIGGLTLSLTTD
jgi:hypothetical protein